MMFNCHLNRLSSIPARLVERKMVRSEYRYLHGALTIKKRHLKMSDTNIQKLNYIFYLFQSSSSLPGIHSPGQQERNRSGEGFCTDPGTNGKHSRTSILEFHESSTIGDIDLKWIEP